MPVTVHALTSSDGADWWAKWVWMVNRFSLALCGVLPALSVAGGEKERAADSDLPEKLTLYSMKFGHPDKEPKTAESFHGYPVLGKVEITDPKRRQKIVTALDDGLNHGKT